MPNELPVLFVLEGSAMGGTPKLTEEGKRVAESKNFKYLDFLRHRFNEQLAAAIREKAEFERKLKSQQAEYERKDNQYRRDLKNKKISFETARDLINGLGIQPEAICNMEGYWKSPTYTMVPVFEASRDLVIKRMNELSPRNKSQLPPEEVLRQGDPSNTIDKRYYEASELDLEEIRDLAKRIAERTKKPKINGYWLLETRHFKLVDKEGGCVEETRASIYYYLHDDGQLATHFVQCVESIYAKEEHASDECVMQERDILLFDFKPRYISFKRGNKEGNNDRDPSNEVIVPWKGFGMKSLLYGLLSEPVKKAEKAAVGDACSQYKLGICYFYGASVSRDFAEAVKWFQKAAKQGNADAQFSLGRCYQYGCGLTQDLGRAKQWYGDAAKLGHEKAQAKLDQDLRW